MKRCLATVAAIVTLAASSASWSKGAIAKITLEPVGGGTPAIEITQPEVLDRFAIWSGPGTGGWDMVKTVPNPDDAAFIVDWTKGIVSDVPSPALTYKVTMYVDGYSAPCNKYEVLYRFGGTAPGYVYLPRVYFPRWNEAFGRCNTRLILRDVEGNWFRASHAWDEVAARVLRFAAPATVSSPAKCPITSAYRAENDDLWASSSGGKVVFEPGGPGFVDHDGALGIKWPFVRKKPGRLFVGGRRLDGTAGPARAYIYDYGDSGFQPIYLLFPAPGCWEISAGVGAATSPLVFVVRVEKIGDGPSWRRNGPGAGRRVTTHWREE